AFTDAVARIRVDGGRFEAALVALDGVLLLGPGHPTSQVLAAEARPVLEGCQARSFIALLDAALAAGEGIGVSPG
ncbi:MAG TPA: hypothetical protein VIH37_13565, partial [Candidatus Limnocylindrales bacterium]